MMLLDAPLLVTSVRWTQHVAGGGDVPDPSVVSGVSVQFSS